MSERPRHADDLEPDQLFELVYQELRQLARGYLGRERAAHTLQPTALVHEAWMRVNQQRQVAWQGRTHMLAIGAQAMRRLLIDHGRNRKRVKRGGGRKAETLYEWLDAGEDQPLAIEDALSLAVAMAKLAQTDARQAEIVELRFFAGLTVPEVAERLGVSTRTVEGEWTHARAWLKRELREKD